MSHRFSVTLETRRLDTAERRKLPIYLEVVDQCEPVTLHRRYGVPAKLVQRAELHVSQYEQAALLQVVDKVDDVG